MLHEPLMNVNEISFFMRHTLISRKEDKMSQTFHKYRGISGFNFLLILEQVAYTLILKY